MPFVQHDKQEWERRARRTLLVGSPNTRKTSSLATWPGPRLIVSYPGEKGTASIPRDEGTKALVWNQEDALADTNWKNVWNEVLAASKDAIGGKHGPIKTFAGDGLHKLYQTALAHATFGASARAESFDAKLYGNATTMFFQYLDFVMRSPIENVVFTVWDGHEKDDPDEKGPSPSRHIWPELPGQAAKRIMGEFSLVLYATKEPTGKYVWYTQPQGKVWGAGAKLPVEIAKRLPVSLEQDWGKLEQVIFAAP